MTLTFHEPDVVIVKVAGVDRGVVANLLLDAAIAIEAEARMRRAAAPATRYLTDRADRLRDLSSQIRP